MLWDVFCRVIDNFGDIGVCWRLSADLAARGHSVRLWADDASALSWMAPGALQNQWPGIQVLNGTQIHSANANPGLPCADVWVETFGCEIPPIFWTLLQAADVAKRSQPPVWINLEYLSAESYVERSHTLPSPVRQGPGAGRTKYYFYPGFTSKTGGLLREPGVTRVRLPAPDRAQFLAQCGVDMVAGRLVSLFCYEPPLLETLLKFYAQQAEPTQLLVTQGRAAQSVRALAGAQKQLGNLHISYLSLLAQTEFDRLLRCCDVNWVRGEDSVIRSIWAGAPFVWQIYPQDDGADGPKLEAFLEAMQLSPPVRELHRAWNGMRTGSPAEDLLRALEPASMAQWQAQLTAARDTLLKMDDLTSQLIQFVRKKR